MTSTFDYLKEDKPCFICLTAMDAAAVMAASGEYNAICLTADELDTKQADKTLKRLKDELNKQPTKCELLVHLGDFGDNETSDEVVKGLADECGVDCYLVDFDISKFGFGEADICESVNQLYEKNKDVFLSELKTNVERARAVADEKRRQRLEALTARSVKGGLMKALQEQIETSVKQRAISTGFYMLDDYLGGGMYNGFYILGGETSCGKTTFALNWVDALIAQNVDVLYYSLEMGADELLARSISRLSFLKDGEGKALTALDILQGRRYMGYTDTRGKFHEPYSDEKRNRIRDYMSDYTEYPGNLVIHESVGNVSVDDIRTDVRDYIALTGRTPCVLVDYLQILKAHNERATDKQNADYNVISLKKISRDFKTVVIGISSFNRSNYDKQANYAAFKESGALEYSADVLLALQPQGNKTEDRDKNSEGDERQLELVVLKNRYGRRGKNAKVKYVYRAKSNVFQEEQDANNFNPYKGKTPFDEPESKQISLDGLTDHSV